METSKIKTNPSRLKTLKVGNLEFGSAFDFRLTEKDLEKAHRELNEREDTKQRCIRQLKERLEGDEEILFRTDDSYLLGYLRFSKFNCDKAYSTMRRYNSLRIKHPEYFALPPSLESLFNRRFFTCLPYKDGEGRPIFFINFRNWNTDEMSFSEVLLMIPVFADLIFANPHTQISGIVGVWDFQGLSMSQMSQTLQPSNLRFVSGLLQECYPRRVKYIFAINCNALMKTIYASVRYLIKNKMIDRVKILGSDLTELYKHVDPAVLPKECGGSLEESECSITDHIMDNFPYLKYERSFGLKTNSKLR